MLNKLKIKIETNQIIEKRYFQKKDLDELLDMREDKEFDFEWMRVFDSLNRTEVKPSEKEAIDTIRAKSFLMAYNLSESSEIAGYVSDDFEIICKAYILDYNDIWLNSLIMSYAKGEFPCGQLNKTNCSMEECMDMLLK